METVLYEDDNVRLSKYDGSDKYVPYSKHVETK
jgi:hypothetical protein